MSCFQEYSETSDHKIPWLKGLKGKVDWITHGPSLACDDVTKLLDALDQLMEK